MDDLIHVQHKKKMLLILVHCRDEETEIGMNVMSANNPTFLKSDRLLILRTTPPQVNPHVTVIRVSL